MKHQKRLDWVDNLRGFSILAVIFLHSSLALNNIPGHLNIYSDFINEILGPVRLGMMFFVSGLFVEYGLKKGISNYVKNKYKNILYPFIIWSCIYASLKIIFMSKSNHQQSIENVITMHLTGGGDITWFLHSLFIFFIIILAARKIPFWVVFLTCMTLSQIIPDIPAGSIFSSFDNNHINKSIYLFIFFYMGDLLVRKNINMDNFINGGLVIKISACSFLLMSLINLNFKPPYQALSPLALLSIPLFIYLSIRIKSKTIIFIGSNSIVFYLTHNLVIQFFSKMINFNDQSELLQDIKFLLAFISAIIFPWVICKLREKGLLKFLFAAGDGEKQRKILKTV